jgi:Rrf2 family transcriptional regulator, cysteine metabolism repressor
MLKLSKKGLYGVKALYELAKNYGGSPVKIREISDRQGLPLQFLEQVLCQLKNEGIVVSIRGVKGGYVLSRPPADISIGDAVRALEGPIALCDCHLKSGVKVTQIKQMHCVSTNIYRHLEKKVEQAFDSVSLRELAEQDVAETAAGLC